MLTYLHILYVAYPNATVMQAKNATTSSRRCWYQAKLCTGETRWFFPLCRRRNSSHQTARSRGLVGSGGGGRRED